MNQQLEDYVFVYRHIDLVEGSPLRADIARRVTAAAAPTPVKQEPTDTVSSLTAPAIPEAPSTASEDVCPPQPFPMGFSTGTTIDTRHTPSPQLADTGMIQQDSDPRGVQDHEMVDVPKAHINFDEENSIAVSFLCF